MILAPDLGGTHGTSGRPTFAAATDAVICDHTAHLPAIARAVLRDSDGLDFDNVEHVRQNRLKRWQTPPDPTRRDSR